MKVKSGVIAPHPSGEPGRCVIYSLDAMTTSIPEWGLSMLLKTMIRSEMKKRCAKFKASTYYAELAAR